MRTNESRSLPPRTGRPVDLIEVISGLMTETLQLEIGSSEDDLLATGALDSLTLVQLLVTLESHFSIRIPLEDLQIEDVRSVKSIAQLVKTRLDQSPSGEDRELAHVRAEAHGYGAI